MAVPIFTWHLESAGRAARLSFVARKHALIESSAMNSSANSRASLPQMLHRNRSSIVERARTLSSGERLEHIARVRLKNWLALRSSRSLATVLRPLRRYKSPFKTLISLYFTQFNPVRQHHSILLILLRLPIFQGLSNFDGTLRYKAICTVAWKIPGLPPSSRKPEDFAGGATGRESPGSLHAHC